MGKSDGTAGRPGRKRKESARRRGGEGEERGRREEGGREKIIPLMVPSHNLLFV